MSELTKFYATKDLEDFEEIKSSIAIIKELIFAALLCESQNGIRKCMRDIVDYLDKTERTVDEFIKIEVDEENYDYCD